VATESRRTGPLRFCRSSIIDGLILRNGPVLVLDPFGAELRPCLGKKVAMKEGKTANGIDSASTHSRASTA